MAGGPTTPDLVAAVAAGGGLGILPGGYRTGEQLTADLQTLREQGVPFGVNLFAPHITPVDPAAYDSYRATLAARRGSPLEVPITQDDDHWADKIAVLVKQPVPFFTVTFGLVPANDLQALQRVGTRVGITVTSVEEAVAAADTGADFLVVQGIGAGGHSGVHDPRQLPRDIPTADLVRAVRTRSTRPIIAAGGVDGPESVRGLLAAGADAVAVGTLLLRTDEAGTSAVHRAALADESFTETRLTHCFTGRPARALRTRFIDEFDAQAPLGYPAIHHLTRPLRQAAAQAGDPHGVHLWAGTGWRSAQNGPAADLIRSLAP
ncbi:nitronate monooxygenase [Calidifontibacter terrae]